MVVGLIEGDTQFTESILINCELIKRESVMNLASR
jgi:hypothetical protein